MGDFVSDKGPAIVNKHYRNYIKNECFICATNNKFIRIVHFMICLPWTKILLVSGLSKFHLSAIKIAKKRGIKVVYLMHGYDKMEYDINCVPQQDRILEKVEEEILKEANKVICVSKLFAEYMKKQKRNIASKFDFVNNGVSYENNELKRKVNDTYTIISVGGGVRRKNNLDVCKAIEKINKPTIKFIIIGNKGKDGEEILKYNFVEYYENLEHNEVLRRMHDADLYIQNSYYDTFGLAVIEALEENCRILIGKNVGAISILNNLNENMVIENNEDIDEIKNKIIYAIKNNEDKLPTIDYNICCWENRTKELLEKLGEVMNE